MGGIKSLGKQILGDLTLKRTRTSSGQFAPCSWLIPKGLNLLAQISEGDSLRRGWEPSGKVLVWRGSRPVGRLAVCGSGGYPDASTP